LCWSQDIKTDVDLAILEKANQTDGPLYGQFTNYIETNIPKQIEPNFPELAMAEDKQFGVKSRENVTSKRPLGLTGLWLDTLIMPDGTQTEVPSAIWQRLLYAEGWTLRGPEGDWPITG